MAAERTSEGYLLLADISGYTAFLTGNELEHAHGIIEDLTRAIIGAFPGPWRFVKIEGDAVFVYAVGSAFASAERSNAATATSRASVRISSGPPLASAPPAPTSARWT